MLVASCVRLSMDRPCRVRSGLPLQNVVPSLALSQATLTSPFSATCAFLAPSLAPERKSTLLFSCACTLFCKNTGGGGTPCLPPILPTYSSAAIVELRQRATEIAQAPGLLGAHPTQV